MEMEGLVTKRPDWGFYGRAEELERFRRMLGLHKPIEERKFKVYTVSGRRGVGKSALVERTMDLPEDDTPFIHLEAGENQNAATCLETLRVTIDDTGYGGLLDGLPEPHPLKSADWRFTDIVGHLIAKGAVVAIDEFQRCVSIGIADRLKTMVDRFHRNRYPKPPGRAIAFEFF